jgi:hypothetical protein
MKNAEALRDQLSEVFTGLRNGTVKHSEAAELANIAGKMINSARAQVEYYTLRKEEPRIAFLESSTDETQG